LVLDAELIEISLHLETPSHSVPRKRVASRGGLGWGPLRSPLNGAIVLDANVPLDKNLSVFLCGSKKAAAG
jgi:hypothetical protein